MQQKITCDFFKY